MKTEIITLKASPDFKERTTQAARERGISRSELFRQAVHLFLAASDNSSRQPQHWPPPATP